jgi:hypothetical protein
LIASSTASRLCFPYTVSFTCQLLLTWQNSSFFRFCLAFTFSNSSTKLFFSFELWGKFLDVLICMWSSKKFDMWGGRCMFYVVLKWCLANLTVRGWRTEPIQILDRMKSTLVIDFSSAFWILSSNLIFSKVTFYL